jgi:hypothetical protein
MDPIERLKGLQIGVRRELLDVLESLLDERTDLIRRLRERGDDELAEILAEIAKNDPLRQGAIDALRASLADGSH